MPNTSLRTAMTVVALAAIIGIVGAVGFIASRDEAPPVTTTTTTTADPRPAYVAAIATALAASTQVPLGPEQAACVATALFDGLGEQRLSALADQPDPLSGLSPDDRRTALRAVVTCVPSEVAEALLAGSTTTSILTGLPDEGSG